MNRPFTFEPETSGAYGGPASRWPGGSAGCGCGGGHRSHGRCACAAYEREGELESEGLFSFSSLPGAVVKALRDGLERVALATAVAVGARNENTITSGVFFQRHLDRCSGGTCKKLVKGERGFAALSQEWVTIRDTLVRPVLWREFFKEYNLRSLPDDPVHGIPANTKLDAAQKAQRRTDVLAMVGAGPDRLVARRSKRAAEALAGRIMPPTPVPAALKPAVERLSKMQLDLFKEFFPNGAGGISLDPFQGAFEQFANGQLRPPGGSPDHIGEPRGDFYFLFAEFAFACVDSGIKKDEWEPLLRTFVKTQEIFIHVYRPAPGGGAAFPLPPSVWGAAGAPPRPGAARRSLDGAFDFTNFNPRGQSNATRKAALRKKYNGMKIDALRRAARDNLLRAQRML